MSKKKYNKNTELPSQNRQYRRQTKWDENIEKYVCFRYYDFFLIVLKQISGTLWVTNNPSF